MSDGGRTLFFNGLEGATGDYCLSPIESHAVAEWMHGFRAPRLLRAGSSPRSYDEAGWGVVWSEGTSPLLREALEPLVALRRGQAGPLFRELDYYPAETVFDFLERYGAGPGSVDPSGVPFYLLLVGSPVNLPFSIQVELAISRAVGRISFDTPEAAARYAERVVAFESSDQIIAAQRRVTLFGVENEDDPLTQSARENFVEPLGRTTIQRGLPLSVDVWAGANATKRRLSEILDDPPEVLLTASHAVRFRPDSPRQASHQGALVCADWPGPEAWRGRGPMLDDHLFAAADVPIDADLSGLVALLFACYSAGTPQFDDYGSVRSEQRAHSPFVSPLPATLLERGALAVIGHVDLAFEHSFLWFRAGPQIEVFGSLIHEVAEAAPVGLAMRHLSYRHAELAAHVARVVTRVVRDGGEVAIRDIQLWAAYVDARNYILLGDPAARLPSIPEGAAR